MNINKVIKTRYRPEIDGLRAFAIVAVIINHFNKEIIPNGFLGVDIFFVISGYVITSSLKVIKSKNLFDFISSFYIKRIKRLFPALIIFILFTSLFICLFSFEPDNFLRTGLSSLFGLSNIALFWASKDYFADATALNPFIHTWSLGVEEQFYFLFPLIIWMTGFRRKTKRGIINLFLLLLFLVILSLISFIYFYSNNQTAVYYLMPFRFWEIALGSLIFLTDQIKVPLINRLKNTPAILILLIIIGGLFLPQSLAKETTILVVFLTSLLLLSLKEGSIAFKIFTNRKVVYIGLISYSLYLWHWGIIAISLWTIGIYWWTIPFQIGIIFIIANLSYKFVESPLRRGNWQLNKRNTISIALLALSINSFILILLQKPVNRKLYLGDRSNFKQVKYYSLNDDEDFCKPIHKKYTSDGYLKSAKCFIKNKENNPTLFFLGDSHNMAFLKGSEFIAKETNSNIAYEFSLLPATPGYRWKKRKGIKANELIPRIKTGDILFIKIRMPYKFIDNWYETASLTNNYEKKDPFEGWLFALQELMTNLEQKNIKFIIFTPTPEYSYARFFQCEDQNPQWFNKFSKKDCTLPIDFFNSKNGKYALINQRLKEVASKYKNLYLFDALNVMCPNSECRYSLNNNLLYRDDDHISDYSARYIVAPKLLKFLEVNKIISTK